MNMSKLKFLTTASLLTVVVSAPVWADDTEIFFGSGSGSSSGNPNIMLILEPRAVWTAT
jgi:hypothetical protein